MSLVGEVARHLAARGIPHAVIGAMALAMRGISRATADADLLVTDRRVLQASTWEPLAARVEIRRGDADDPLAGVVRLTREGDTDVDVVVARELWKDDVLSRAELLAFEDGSLAVVTAADLVLLKLDAGGALDRWDAAHLVSTDVDGSLRAEVESRIGVLSQDARRLWSEIAKS